MNRITEKDEISPLSPYTKTYRFKNMMNKIMNFVFFQFSQLCSILIGILFLCLSPIFFVGGPDARRSSSGTVHAIVFFILGIAIIYFAVNWRNLREKKDKNRRAER